MILRWSMGIVLLVLLAACGQTAPAETDTGDAAADETAQSLIDNQLADIETAVEANDIEAARTAFEEFEAGYADIAADVEAAGPPESERAAAAMGNLETVLNSSTPDMVVVNEQLGVLQQELAAVSAKLSDKE